MTGDRRTGDAAFAVGITALAWVAGYAVPGAPAGLGVREAVLLAGLSLMVGEAHAVVVVLLLRVVTTLGDGLLFAVSAAIPWGSSMVAAPSD